MTDLLVKKISAKLPALEIRENEPMSEHCSFKIGGPARALALPKSLEELSLLLEMLRQAGEESLVIGNGTNLLISDKGTDKIVVKLSEGFSGAELLANGAISAYSGITLARLAAFARDKSLEGMEFAHGIPGSLGGAIFMNAGAYGGEMKDIIECVRYIDGETGELRSIENAEALFAYRRSRFCGKSDVIVAACLRLARGEREKINEKMRVLAEKRRSSQPLDKPSAGSTFKRPEGGYAAAMIDECGLKGYSIGGAQVSPKHAGFVVNTGGATFADVMALMEHIRSAVLREKGVLLEPELRIIAD